MDYFEYKNGELYCENLPVKDIAYQVGTPVYIYSAATFKHHFRAFAEAFAKVNPLI